jgi:glucan phosphoethanolaminetransferase (alkaline phosphatase superfamily)
MGPTPHGYKPNLKKKQNKKVHEKHIIVLHMFGSFVHAMVLHFFPSAVHEKKNIT